MVEHSQNQIFHNGNLQIFTNNYNSMENFVKEKILFFKWSKEEI